MNDKLDIDLFNSLKSKPECLDLETNIIYSIIDSFSNNDLKNKKYKTQQKKVLNVLKNPKIKLIKNKICNKVNLILNKLSENNISNLVIEFIENTKISNLEDYNEFLKTIYFKIISEINFIKIYLNFFELITETYFIVYNFTTEYFFNLIENKFYIDYDLDYDINYYFENEQNNDNKRLNNLTLINELINLNYFNDEFKNIIEDCLLDQKKYLSDIHHWFKNNKISNNQLDLIKIILENDIQLRDKVLLENLLNGNISKIIFKTNIQPEKKLIIQPEKKLIIQPEKKLIIQPDKKINIDNIELDNILEEYLFIDNSESLENYIEINCTEATSKNKFCEYLIDKYFKFNDNKKIIILLKLLVKKKILFKSNLSRGLINLYQNKNMNLEKLKNFLLFLKNQGITKGLECLMTKCNI
jgi:hypothetical protein